MPADRQARLEQLLATENSKKIPSDEAKKARSPAQYREMLNSSSSTQYSHITREDVARAAKRQEDAQRRTTARVGSTAKSSPSKHNPLANSMAMTGGMQFTSVYQGKPGQDQTHVKRLAEQTRKAKTESEWALLTSLDKTLAEKDREDRKRREMEKIAKQRAALDKQMQEKLRLQESDKAAKAAELQVMRSQLEAFQEDERRTMEEIRVRDEAIKAERNKQLAEVRTLRQSEVERKKRKEAEEMQRIEEQMEADKLAAEERRKEASRVMMVTLEENTRLQEEKSAKAKEQQEAEEQMMKEYIARLEREEQERARKLEEFKRAIQEKADRVGTVLTKDREERERKEQELLEKLERKKERDEKRKEKDEKRNKKKMWQEIKYTNEQIKAMKAELQADERAKEDHFSAMIRDDDERAKSEGMEKRLQAKLRNLEHRKFLEGQMFHKEMLDTVDNVFMSEDERKLNTEILAQAATELPHNPAAMTLTMHQSP